MNRIVILIVLLAVTTLHIEAKKAKKNELDKQQKEVEETKEAGEPDEEGAEFPGFALRIPIPNFGALAHMREQLQNLFPAGQKAADYKPGKTKTTTSTKNSTRGPFKTYSVTSETVSTDNKSSPHVLSKVYKSITTLDKDKLPKGKDGKLKIPSAMEFDFGPFGAQFHDEEGKKCSLASDCENVEYCDAFFGVCKKRLNDGAACTQKDQCDSKFKCTWGRCIKNSEEGSSGTFCDSDSECHSTDEELTCRDQPDISRFYRVCMAKLGEGATCGHSNLFDLFRPAEEVSNYCKKGLECKTVGFFGRKACIRPQETKSIDDEVSKKEIKSNKAKKEDKSKKLKF